MACFANAVSRQSRRDREKPPWITPAGRMNFGDVPLEFGDSSVADVRTDRRGQKASRRSASIPGPLRSSRASGAVVEAYVSFERFSPLKSTSALRPQPEGGRLLEPSCAECPVCPRARRSTRGGYSLFCTGNRRPA